jgi:two-component system KDP operon response regulator KdpE
MPDTTQDKPPQILVVEDDSSIRQLLRSALTAENWGVLEADSATTGIEMILSHRPQIVLLDLGLPDREGLSVVKEVREWSKVPILILSAEGQEAVKVMCLEAGADDYVTKPFGIGELIARVGVALRRQNADHSLDESPTFELSQVKLDRAQRKVWVHGVETHLSPIEYKLLCVLAQYAGRVVTHRQLLSEVWGAEYTEDTQYLRVYVGYLRKKLEPNEESARLLVNEPRIGYRLAVPINA